MLCTYMPAVSRPPIEEKQLFRNTARLHRQWRKKCDLFCNKSLGGSMRRYLAPFRRCFDTLLTSILLSATLGRATCFFFFFFFVVFFYRVNNVRNAFITFLTINYLFFFLSLWKKTWKSLTSELFHFFKWIVFHALISDVILWHS